jgi:ABC-2 type transport system permease protein
MTATTTSPLAANADASDTARIDPALAPVLPMLLRQVRAQARMFLRTPAVSVISLAMPLMLFAFFGMPAIGTPYLPGIDLGTFMLASFAAYAVSSMMVFNYGVTVALDRGQKVDLLMRAAPLPGSVFLLARTLTAIAFSVLALGALFAVALVAGVRLEPGVWASLAIRLVVGAVPFVGLGFAIAYLCSPSAAPAVANLLFIALAFGSGMLIRVDQMPDFLAAVAPYLPTYHYAQLGWGAIGAAGEDTLVAVAWLTGYAVLFFAVATRAYRREAARKFS